MEGYTDDESHELIRKGVSKLLELAESKQVNRVWRYVSLLALSPRSSTLETGGAGVGKTRRVVVRASKRSKSRSKRRKTRI